MSYRLVWVMDGSLLGHGYGSVTVPAVVLRLPVAAVIERCRFMGQSVVAAASRYGPGDFS
jgi:hypothetical protein